MPIHIEECPTNTPEQVESYIADALALVARMEIAGDLRAIAFTKAVDLFASKQVAAIAHQGGAVDLSARLQRPNTGGS